MSKPTLESGYPRKNRAAKKEKKVGK